MKTCGGNSLLVVLIAIVVFVLIITGELEQLYKKVEAIREWHTSTHFQPWPPQHVEGLPVTHTT